MPQRVATEGVTSEQNNVGQQHERTDTDAEAISEPTGLPDIEKQNDNKNQRQVQEVAVNILEDERKGTLTEVLLARFTDGTGGRVGPKSLVVSATIVIASDAESAGGPEDEECSREWKERREPRRLAAKPGVQRISPQLRRVEG